MPVRAVTLRDLAHSPFQPRLTEREIEELLARAPGDVDEAKRRRWAAQLSHMRYDPHYRGHWYRVDDAAMRNLSILYRNNVRDIKTHLLWEQALNTFPDLGKIAQTPAGTDSKA